MPLLQVSHGLNTTPLEVYYETLGTGSQKVVFIMGLNASNEAWLYQKRFFRVPSHAQRYTALFFDNRGVGRSGAPFGRYTTRLFAEDTLAMLRTVGWISEKGKEGGEERHIHGVGTSMGGMILQELALLEPRAWKSLSLLNTHLGLLLQSPTSMYSFPRILFCRTDEERAVFLSTMLFPKSWLSVKSSEDPIKTNQEVFVGDTMERLRTVPKQKPMGALGQILAALTHRVGKKRSARLKETFKGRILVVTGSEDKIILPHHSVYLANEVGAKIHVIQGGGHAIPSERPEWLNGCLDEFWCSLA